MMIKRGKMFETIVSYFLENKKLKELNLRFSEPLKVSREEYEKLIGYDESCSKSFSIDGNKIDRVKYGEEYIDKEMRKQVVANILFEYSIDNEKMINIKEIKMWREIEDLSNTSEEEEW